MKKKFLAVFASLFVFGSVSSFAFDWSQCWCNYGGGIQEGDFILNIDGGLCYNDLVYTACDDYWFIPPVMVEMQYAQPIWKLPFTFGGYAGFRAYGYSYDIRKIWSEDKSLVRALEVTFRKGLYTVNKVYSPNHYTDILAYRYMCI